MEHFRRFISRTKKGRQRDKLGAINGQKRGVLTILRVYVTIRGRKRGIFLLKERGFYRDEKRYPRNVYETGRVRAI